MPSFWKDKKIIVFIALAHHTRFILPVTEKIKHRGGDVKYVVGQAERSQEITAIELGLEYSHIFDFVTEKDYPDIRKNYQLLINTMRPALKNHFLLGTNPVTVTDKTLYSSAVEYVGFRNLLETRKPDLCFALHELNRWGKMMGFWSKKLNIPFITLQEGLGYNLDFGYTGHAQYSTLNLVWGERIRKKFSSFQAPADKIIPVGNTHLSKEMERQEKENIRELKRKEYRMADSFASLLILSSRLPDAEKFTPLFETVSGKKNLGLFVKFHPATREQGLNRFMEAIPEDLRKNSYFIHNEENTYDLISASDACILAQPSTTGLEAAAFGKPLIKLDFAYNRGGSYSFVDQGVAVKMSVKELSEALKSGTDFSALMDNEKRTRFLNNELSDTTRAADNVADVFEKVILAGRSGQNQPLSPENPPDMDWSVIITVPDSPDTFLTQLKALAANSENCGSFETVIIEPETVPGKTRDILDSLQGDVRRIKTSDDFPATEAMNFAGTTARGKRLLFFRNCLAPLPEWLDLLKKGFETHGDATIFGSRIADGNNQIVHGGVAVDHNNAPVNLFSHLDIDFPAALKKRALMMVDHFCGVEKNFFCRLGGFTKKAGDRIFPDLCLKARKQNKDTDSAVYLPDVKMLMLEKPPAKTDAESSAYFFARW
ncbi:MAG: hypothetical protein R6V41_05625, partial [Desulfobacteraceae bacterium]